MNYLAIDTSGSHLTVIAEKDGAEAPYVYYKEDCALQHSVQLMGAIDQALEKADLDRNDVDVFCAVTGPGSFTGIRIGVSTVKALAYALNKKTLGVTSFDVLAYNIITENSLAVIDAKHGHVYSAGYNKGEVDLQPAYTAVADLESLSKGRTIVFSSEIAEVKGKKVLLTEGLRAAVKANLYRATEDPDALNPLYIRKSQAEEGR